MQAKELIDQLVRMTIEHKQRVMSMKGLDDAVLNTKPDSDSWSALECLEHLIRYGNFYLPEIRKSIENARHAPSGHFKSGWLGNYFANMMLPGENSRKIKTFKRMNPDGSDLDKTVVSSFIDQQNEMLDLLEASKNVNLSKTKTSITLSPWMKLRLGDTLRVVIYHNLRHVEQAEKAIAAVSR